MDVKNYAGLFEKVINKMLRRIALSRYMFFDFGPIYKKNTPLNVANLQVERLHVNRRKTGTSWLPLRVFLFYISALPDRVGNTMF